MDVLVVLSPVVEVFAFSQFLQHPCPKLGPVFFLELLDTQSQVELCRVAAQERIVLLLFSNRGGTLEIKSTSKRSPPQRLLIEQCQSFAERLKINKSIIEDKISDFCYSLPHHKTDNAFLQMASPWVLRKHSS